MENGQHFLYTLTPVSSIDGTLIGAWYGAPRLLFDVYFSDNSVFRAQAWSFNNGSTAVPPGIENGCYTYNFTASGHPGGQTVPADTKGTGGLSGLGSNAVNFFVAGDNFNGELRSVAQ